MRRPAKQQEAKRKGEKPEAPLVFAAISDEGVNAKDGGLEPKLRMKKSSGLRGRGKLVGKRASGARRAGKVSVSWDVRHMEAG